MRALERKRPPVMNRSRWFVLILFILTLIGVIIFFSYRSIHAGIWQEKAEVQQFIEQTKEYDLASADLLQKYVWENVYWMLLANKVSDNMAYYSVWTQGDRLAELEYSKTISEESMLTIVHRDRQGATSIHVQPGYAFNQFVWEVKYRDQTTDHMKIAFYSLSDATFIDEYTIPQETRP